MQGITMKTNMIFTIFLLGMSSGVMQACEDCRWGNNNFSFSTDGDTQPEYWGLCASAQTAYSVTLERARVAVHALQNNVNDAKVSDPKPENPKANEQVVASEILNTKKE